MLGEQDKSELPYIKKRVSRIIRLYNPKYGDERVCECGHTYDRHFDGYEEPENAAVGCKYCSCYTFKEAKNVSRAD